MWRWSEWHWWKTYFPFFSPHMLFFFFFFNWIMSATLLSGEFGIYHTYLTISSEPGVFVNNNDIWLKSCCKKKRKQKTLFVYLWLSHTASVPSWNLLELISPDRWACASLLKFRLDMLWYNKAVQLWKKNFYFPLASPYCFIKIFFLVLFLFASVANFGTVLATKKCHQKMICFFSAKLLIAIMKPRWGER